MMLNKASNLYRVLEWLVVQFVNILREKIANERRVRETRKGKQVQ